jgi:hypothetical protein
MSLAIFAVRQQFGDTFDYGDIPNIKFGDYLIFKVYKPNVRETKLSNRNLTMRSDVIYDIESDILLKDRFGGPKQFPEELSIIYYSVVDVIRSRNDDFHFLKGKYSNKNLLIAIYLTNNFIKYNDFFDILEYRSIQLRFGEILPYNIVSDVIDKYPENFI